MNYIGQLLGVLLYSIMGGYMIKSCIRNWDDKYYMFFGMNIFILVFLLSKFISFIMRTN